MNRQLGDFTFFRVYVDDISVFSSSFNEHINDLLIVFDRLFLSGIKLNWAKCFFFQHHIAILGHIIVHNKIMMNPLKIDKIRDMTPSKSNKDLHGIMGLFSYYRRYIKNIAQIALPLYKLLQNNEPWVWLESQINAFNTL